MSSSSSKHATVSPHVTVSLLLLLGFLVVCWGNDDDDDVRDPNSIIHWLFMFSKWNILTNYALLSARSLACSIAMEWNEIVRSRHNLASGLRKHRRTAECAAAPALSSF